MISLLARQFRASPWPTLLLAFTVAVLSLIVTAVPRLSSDLDDRQLAQRLSTLSAIQGDVAGAFTPPLTFPSEPRDPWPGIREAAANTRDSQPEPLRSLLQPPQFIGVQPVGASWTPDESSGYYIVMAELLIDPDLRDNAELVDGAWPEIGQPDEPFQVAVLDTFAERAQLEVGSLTSNDYVVSGVYRVPDPDNSRWQHNPYGADYHENEDPNRGTELLGGMFLDPDLAAGDPSARFQSPFAITVYYELDAASVTASGVDVAELSAQLTGMQAKRYPTSTDDVLGPNQDFPFHSELGAALDQVLDQQRTTRTLVAVSAVGPIGVGIALVVLGAQLVLHRRRSSVALLSARGRSRRQLRRLVATEGVVAGLPAALVGHLAALALVPGPVPWWSWPVTVLIGLLPAAALAWVVRDDAHGTRREVASGNGRWRLVAEILIALAAAAATWRLLTSEPAAGGGVDLFGAASPVLIALLACLLVLRVYPLPLRLLSGVFQRGRGVTGFLGAARALREPAGGVVPVVTIVLGTTMAVTGAALLGTISVATERAAWAETGSDVHVSGPKLGDETLESMRAIEGVAAVAPISQGADNAALTVGETTARVRVWLAEPDLIDAYLAGRDGSPVPGSLFDDGEPTPVVVGGPEAPTVGTGTLDQLGEVRIVRHLEQLPGVTDAAAWVLVPRDRWPGEVGRPTTTLVSLADGADAEAVVADIQALSPRARITLVDDELEAMRASPTVAGLSRIFVALALGTAVLMVLAIFTAQVMTGRQRRSTAAVLRTLGLRPRQLRSLTAWELGPVVVVALLVGVAVGIGLAALMLYTVDFRSLTGGGLTPRLYLDPLGVGGVAVGLLLATALAVAVSVWLAGRTNVAEELRHGEER